MRDDRVGVSGVLCLWFLLKRPNKALVNLFCYMGSRAKDQRRRVLAVANDVEVISDLEKETRDVAAMLVADVFECLAAVVDTFVT